MSAHTKILAVLAAFGLLEVGLLCVKGVFSVLFDPILRALGA